MIPIISNHHCISYTVYARLLINVMNRKIKVSYLKVFRHGLNFTHTGKLHDCIYFIVIELKTLSLNNYLTVNQFLHTYV